MGSNLEEDLVSAFEAASAAAEQWGYNVEDIIAGISASMASINSSYSSSDSGTSAVIGTTTYDTTASNSALVTSIVSQMKRYSSLWDANGDASMNSYYHDQVVSLAGQLANYGVTADYDSHTGTWTITDDELNPSNIGRLLYNCYHSGGIVGGGTVESNEELAKLKDDEWVLSEEMVENLILQMERVQALTEGMEGLPDYMGSLMAVEGAGVTKSTVSNVINNNNRPMQVYFGDTVINGASSSGVKQYQQITEESLNQMAKLLGIRR